MDIRVEKKYYNTNYHEFSKIIHGQFMDNLWTFVLKKNIHTRITTNLPRIFKNNSWTIHG